MIVPIAAVVILAAAVWIWIVPAVRDIRDGFEIPESEADEWEPGMRE
jgi:hypothetical protein